LKVVDEAVINNSIITAFSSHNIMIALTKSTMMRARKVIGDHGFWVLVFLAQRFSTLHSQHNWYGGSFLIETLIKTKHF
jgi:hypothetical protein